MIEPAKGPRGPSSRPIDLESVAFILAVSPEPKVFVGQAPIEATQEDVFNLFSKYGTIQVRTEATVSSGTMPGDQTG